MYQSRFGTLLGVPVSIFGGIWFVCAALLSVGGMVARPEVRESIPGYLFALSTLALAAVSVPAVRVGLRFSKRTVRCA